MQPESRAALRRIVNQGWTDALRALHPAEEQLYTFWDYTAGAWQRDAGFRIDHLLCSPARRRPAAGRRRRQMGARRGESVRPCADVDRAQLKGFFVDPVAVVDGRAGQLGDRHHPLIVLEDPAELAVGGADTWRPRRGGCTRSS